MGIPRLLRALFCVSTEWERWLTGSSQLSTVRVIQMLLGNVDDKEPQHHAYGFPCHLTLLLVLFLSPPPIAHDWSRAFRKDTN